METQMCSDLSQCIAILINRLLYCSTSFANIRLHFSTKDLLQGRTVCVTLTPGYLGDIFVLSKMIHEPINKALLTQECLSLTSVQIVGFPMPHDTNCRYSRSAFPRFPLNWPSTHSVVRLGWGFALPAVAR